MKGMLYMNNKMQYTIDSNLDILFQKMIFND